MAAHVDNKIREFNGPVQFGPGGLCIGNRAVGEDALEEEGVEEEGGDGVSLVEGGEDGFGPGQFAGQGEAAEEEEGGGGVQEVGVGENGVEVFEGGGVVWVAREGGEEGEEVVGEVLGVECGRSEGGGGGREGAGNEGFEQGVGFHGSKK